MRYSSVKQNILIMIIAVLALALLGIPRVSAAPNYEINYQGKLLDDANVAVADGLYDMEFKLYTSSTGGSAIWTETLTGADQVQVTSGLFSVMLGSTTPLTSVDFGQTLYLGVNIESDGEMSPRKILGAVPAAFYASTTDTVDGLDSTQFLRSDEPDTMASSSASTLLTVTQNGTGNIFDLYDGGTNVFTVLDGGNIGIGTTTPEENLTIAGVSSYNTGLRVTGSSGTGVGMSIENTGSNGKRYALFSTGSSNSGGAGNFAIYDETGGAYRLFIDSADGNIAIGNDTSPDAKLHVIGGSEQLRLAYSGSSYWTDTVASDGGRSIAGFGSDADLNIDFSGATDGDFSINTDDLFVDTSSGNVGIGTTTPTSTLDVVDSNDGVAHLSLYGDGGGNKLANLLFVSDGNNVLNKIVSQKSPSLTNTARDIAFVLGDTEVMRVTASGLGIGTTSPLSGLHVDDTLTVGGSGVQSFIDILDQNGDDFQIAVGTPANNAFSIRNTTDDREDLVIDGSGNVGIGTTSPSGKAHVWTGAVRSSYSSNADDLILEGGSNAGLTIAATGYGSIFFSDANDNAVGRIGYNHANDSLGFFTDNSQNLTIDASGNVGIGNTSPQEKLDVSGTASTTNLEVWNNITFDSVTGSAWSDFCTAITGSADLCDGNDAGSSAFANWVQTNGALTPSTTIGISVSASSTIGGGTGATGLTINGGATTTGNAYFAGNVGIGTTSPSAGLHVAGTKSAVIGNVTGSSNNGNIFIDTTVDQFPSIKFRKGTTVNAQMLTNAGGTGLTISVTSGLFANDIGSGGSFLVRDSANGSKVLFEVEQSTGYVGIGTTSPNALLTVAGDINIDDPSSGISILGNRVLYASSTNESILLGTGAGTDLLTDGLRNIAIGYDALAVATSSDDNIAIGHLSQNDTTTGGYNVSVGSNSLRNNTTGGTNTAMGHNTLQYNVTGDSNIAMGTNALRYNISGSSNVGLGNLSLYQNMSGEYNTAVGVFALRQNETGSNNVAFGYQALTSNLASNNIAIGYQAGNALTTGSNNIVLGYDIDLPSVSSSNMLNIGNLIYATGLDGSGTTLSSGNVGIGTTSPSARLSVTGSGTGTDKAFSIADSTNASRFSFLDNGTFNISASNSDNWSTANRQFAYTFGSEANPRLSLSASAANQLLQFNRGGSGAGTIAANGSAIGVLQSMPAGTLAFFTTNGSALTERARIDSSGNVGIGTTSPSNTLTVSGTVQFASTTNGFLYADGTGVVTATSTLPSSAIADDYVLNTGDSISGNLVFSGTAANIALGSNWLSGDGDDEGIFVDGSGNVGVGLTSPSTSLHVVRSGTEGQVPELTLREVAIFQRTSSANGSSAISLLSGNNASSELYFSDTDDINSGKISYNHSSNLLSFGTNDVENRMVIDSSGNVGIGTTTPSYLLDVDGDFRVGEAGSSNALFVDATNGQIGIGTDSPSAALDISGASEVEIAGRAWFGYDGNNVRFQSGSGKPIRFVVDSNTYNSGGTELLTLHDSGNVGVGTATPAHLLDVDGDFRVGEAGSSDAFFVDATSGQVRIGTDQGNATLYVESANAGATPSSAADDLVVEGTGTTGMSILAYNGNSTRLVFGSPSDATGSLLNWNYDAALFTLGTDAAGASTVLTSGDGVEAMRIDENGNVGIGTTTPSAQLTVAGTTLLTDLTATGTITFSDISGSTQCLEVDTNGVVSGTGSACGSGSALANWQLSGGGDAITPTTTAGIAVFASSTIGGGTGATGLTIDGNATTTGELIVQGVGTSTFAGGIEITGSIVPSADDTYTLGTLDRVWKDVYIGPGSLYINGKKVLQEESDTIVVSADPDQNLKVETSGLGTATLRAEGTGNVLLSTGSGNININSTSGNINLGTTGSGQLNLGTINSGVWNGTDIDISDYTNLTVSATGLELSGDAIALASGYAVPLSASTTEWSTAYGWGDHSSAGYLTSLGSNSIEDLSDVASMSPSAGDLLYWSGGAWSNISTSSLGIAGGSEGLATTSIDTEAELESILTDVTDVFTNNDGVLSQWTTSGSDIYYNSGNVGVGGSSINAKLEVIGSGASTDFRISRLGNPSAYLSISSVLGGNTSSQFSVNGNNVLGLQLNGGVQIGSYVNTSSSASAPANGLIIPGNVGIGTTTPSAKLHVDGIIKSGAEGGEYGALHLARTADGASTGRVYTDSNNNLNLYQSGGAGALVLHTAGTEKMRILNNGNVGIGTTSPISDFTVARQSSVNESAIASIVSNYFSVLSLYSDENNDSASGDSAIRFFNDGAFVAEIGTDSSDSETLKFFTGGTAGNFNGAGLAIDSSGNVGVGTTSPNSKLNVWGDSADLFINQADGNYSFGLQSTSEGAGILSIFDDSASGLSTDAKVRLHSRTGEESWVDNGGNFGIGTTTPSYLLDVDGDFRVGEAGSSNALFVDATNGRVGIGTNAPNNALDVAGVITATGAGFKYNNDYPRVTYWASTADLPSISFDSNDGFRYSQSSNQFQYIVGGSIVSAVSSDGSIHTDGNITVDGNIGIGTTTPSARLTVAGETLLTNLTATGTVTFTGLASQDCLGTDANGVLQAGTCGGGGSSAIIAVGYVDGSGTANVITNASVVRESAGLYTITFDTPLASSDYVVNATVEDDGDRNHKIYVANQASTSFQIEIANDDNGTSADVFTDHPFHFTVFDPEGTAFIASGGGSSNWQLTAGADALTPTSTVGIAIFASSTIGDGTQTGGLTISGGATTTGNAYFGAASQFAGLLTADSGLTLSGSASNISLGSNWLSGDGGDEGIYIQADGDVGIGTNNPGSRFEVQTSDSGSYTRVAEFYAPNNTGAGNASQIIFGVSESSGNAAEWRYVHQSSDNSANRLDFGFYGYGTPVMTYTRGGNVGIGTTTPAYKLDVDGALGINNGSIYDVNHIFSGDGTSDAYMQFANGLILNAKAANAVQFRVNDNEYMRLASNGNIGIGTTTPSARLTVAGETLLTNLTATGTVTFTGLTSQDCLGTDANGVLQAGTCGGGGGGAGGDKHAVIVDQKSQGTHGGTFTSGAWQTRDLNTEIYDNIGVTVSSNQFTLPAGTYKIYATAPAYAVNQHKAMLFNITDASVELEGSTEFPVQDSGSGWAQTRSVVSGIFTIADTKTFEVRNRSISTKTTTGFGVAADITGSPEIYTIVNITKLGSGDGVFVASSTDAYFTGGRIGIGTNIPDETLSIQGTAGLNPFDVASSTGTSLLTMTQYGNVGIGTSSPRATLDIDATDALVLPSGTDGQRPTGVAGMIRFNSTSNAFEGFDGTQWGPLASEGGGNTIVSGWPDAIMCYNTGNDDNAILYAVTDRTASGNDDFIYRMPHVSTNYDVIFNSDGSYKTNNNMSGTDCVSNSWSISDLYTQNKARNFIGGSGDSNWIYAAGTLTSTSSAGILVNASSTIGDGTQTGGLTISGGATTTGNAYFGGDIVAEGNVTLADDSNFTFGNDSDWQIQYDEGVDNQLLFVNTNDTSPVGDPMFQILVDGSPSSNQYVFGVSKGTQSSNTDLFYVDEDGDGVFAGVVYANEFNGSGASFSGNLDMTGLNANIDLGSNYISGDGSDEGISINSSGEVLINTTNTDSTFDLHVVDSADSTRVRFEAASGFNSVLSLESDTQTTISSPSSPLNITTASDDLGFYVNLSGTSRAAFLEATGGAFRPGSNNAQTLGTSGSHWDCVYYDATNLGTCSSDARFKSNINDFTVGGDDALEQLTALRPRTFEWNEHLGTENYGFIAQEVLEVAPELVTTEENGKYAVRYGYLPYLTIEAIQQLAERTPVFEFASTSRMLRDGVETLLASSTTLTLEDDGGFWSRLAELVDGFVDGVLTLTGLKADRVEVAEELCIDGVCVTADDLRALLQMQAGQNSGETTTTTGNSTSTATTTEETRTEEETSTSTEETAETGDEEDTSTSTEETGTESSETTNTSEETGTEEGSAEETGAEEVSEPEPEPEPAPEPSAEESAA